MKIRGKFGRPAREKDIKSLIDQRHMLHVLLKNSPDDIYFKDRESCFICMSDSQAKRFGLSGPDDGLGKTDFDFFSHEHARQAFEDEQEIIRTGRAKIDMEEKQTWPDGKETWVSSTKMPFYDRDGRLIGVFGISRDITERKLLEEKLQRQTKVDGLTGLWNRNTFMATGEREIERARRYNQQLSLMMLDIDHFKPINDTYGHAAGDSALRQVSSTIRENLRSVDLPGRLGGEEFGALLPDTGIGGAEKHAERLCRTISGKSFQVRGTKIHLSVSIGVVGYREGIKSFDDLLRLADNAMYRAKVNGRNCVCADVENVGS